MLAKCGCCRRTFVATIEGEMCPTCSEEIVRQLYNHYDRRSIYDDPAGLLVGVFLVFAVGLLTYFFAK